MYSKRVFETTRSWFDYILRSHILAVLSNDTDTRVSEFLLLYMSLTNPPASSSLTMDSEAISQTMMSLVSCEFPYKYCPLLLQAILGLLKMRVVTIYEDGRKTVATYVSTLRAIK